MVTKVYCDGCDNQIHFSIASEHRVTINLHDQREEIEYDLCNICKRQLEPKKWPRNSQAPPDRGY